MKGAGMLQSFREFQPSFPFSSTRNFHTPQFSHSRAANSDCWIWADGRKFSHCRRERHATSDRESRVCGSFPKDRSWNKL